MPITRRRVVILVLDGLGIGAMPDVAETRPRDVGANTLAHIVARVDGLQLPALSALGLAAVAPEAGLPSGPPQGAYGRNRLAYPGADTYMGHQELMGTIPGMVRSQLMSEVRDAIRQALEEQEHTVEDFLPLSPMLLVDGLAVVHDNMETDPGQNINVTAPYDKMPVSSILEIGRIVRSAVALSRVIVVMGWGFDLDDIRHHLREGPRGTVGVDSPGLGVYDERYRRAALRPSRVGQDADRARRRPGSLPPRQGSGCRGVRGSGAIARCFNRNHAPQDPGRLAGDGERTDRGQRPRGRPLRTRAERAALGSNPAERG